MFRRLRSLKNWGASVQDPEVSHVRILWPSLKIAEDDDRQYADYMRYARSQIAIFEYMCPQIRSAHEHLLDDVFGLVASFQQESALTRQRASTIAESSLTVGKSADGGLPPSSDCVWRYVELAVRIWSTLDIRVPLKAGTGPSSLPVSAPARSPGQISHTWTEDNTLQDFIANQFAHKAQQVQTAYRSSAALQTSKTDFKCTMAYLATAYDFRPCWTSNLADHLKIDTRSRTITIFEHKICLWNQLRETDARELSLQGGQTKSPAHKYALPRPVVEETLDTLNILFPFGDKATEAFLRRHGKIDTIYGLGSCRRAPRSDPETYSVWSAGLSGLLDILSRPPCGRAQFFLCDVAGRNLLEFWTFWTATVFGALAIVFGTTGVYSAVYAKLAYDVGVLQYQLALAQACSAENATDLIPDFCH